jgi:hypothetical protein
VADEQAQSDVTLPRVQMAFACEGISQDVYKRFSFNSMLDDLTAQRFPVQTLQFFAVFGLEANVPQMFSRVKVAVDGPNGQKIAEQNLQDIAFTSDRFRVRLMCGFPGITWPVAGRYTFHLLAGTRNLASFSVTLHHVLTAPQPPGMSQNP